MTQTHVSCRLSSFGTFNTVKGKGKGKVFSVLNQATRHEDVLGEWWYSSTHSLTSAVDGGEWSASRPSCFTPRERAPFPHWIGGWVRSRSGLDTVSKRKIPSPLGESNPDHSIVRPVARPYTDWAIPDPSIHTALHATLLLFGHGLRTSHSVIVTHHVRRHRGLGACSALLSQ
jgi:hypothetical protein